MAAVFLNSSYSLLFRTHVVQLPAAVNQTNRNNNLLFNPTSVVLPKMMITRYPPLCSSQQHFYKSSETSNVLQRLAGFDEDNDEEYWDEIDDFASSRIIVNTDFVPAERLARLGDSDGITHFSAAANGLGTKLKLAIESGMLSDAIGIDLVARSFNDLVTCGAKPDYFLDYIYTKGLDMVHVEKIIRGMAIACRLGDCTLHCNKKVADMRGYDPKAEYRLGGDAFGCVETDSIIDGKNIEAGDVLIGLSSSGVHSNGFSLVRRVLEQSGSSLRDNLPGENITIGESLMAPTVIYVKQVLDIISNGGVKGIVHIKDGGLIENIPRIFPTGLGAVIFTDSWVVHPIFKWIQEAGRVEEDEMRRTFNMGIGMVLVVSKENTRRILEEEHGKNVAYRVGEVVQSDGVRCV